MELTRIANHRYTVHRSDDGVAYILRWNQPYGDAAVPRFASRYDLPNSFRSVADAFVEAKASAEQLERGELSFIRERIKKRVRDYEIVASAEFRTNAHRWQPMARIISHRDKNNGAVQELGGPESSLAKNLFDSAPTAAKYALEIGERVVLGFVGGLHV